jgi:ATP adenylyltransferase
MTYEDLKNFIANKMSLAHVYQPVMLKTLLENDGEASSETIAAQILAKDPTQLQYYVDRVKNMVGRVLTKERGITERQGNNYLLNGFNNLSKTEVAELVRLCDLRLEEYENARDGKQWEHRDRTRKPISGSVRYEVIKRARARCEACGISLDQRNLEVDHIVPKSLGGKDDISNYQALCYLCNANKGNRDDTDFRGAADIYAERANDCLFCDLQGTERVVAENTLCYLIEDAYPVTEGHALIIPKRHVSDYFGLTQAEINATNLLLRDRKAYLQKHDAAITGFNIGMNCGEDAGQTIFHCHVHLIPRRSGDVIDPTGGVRYVIPEKANYKK